MDGPLSLAADDEIGHVASVSASQLVVLLHADCSRSGRKTHVALPKGTLIKIANPSSWIYGLVTAVSIPMPSREMSETDMRFAEILLLGEADFPTGGGAPARFERGVSFFPSVGDRVLLATADDLALVYARPSSSSVRVGAIHQDRSIPAYLVPDLLLGKHFAVLGATGSGKSCAAALILRRVLESHRNAHIVVLDPHNEYSAAFPDSAEVIDSSTLELPYWLYTFEELSAIVLGDIAGDSDLFREASILGELVVNAQLGFAGNSDKTGQLTVNTPVPYRMTDLLGLLDVEAGKLAQNKNVTPFQNLKTKINVLRSDSRYRFMFGGISVYDNMARILSRIFRMPVAGKPITILDLSAVPSEVLNIVVAVLSRITFDLAVFSDRSVPVLLVCEEAHRYLPADGHPGFAPAKRILSRIAKEGRKYGVSLGIISQRPADLAISALSQCNTVLALRLTSQADQDFVRAMLPDWAGGLFDFLPSLRNGEAIVVGEGIAVPARVRFDALPPDQLPHGITAKFSAAWQEDTGTASVLEHVVNRWRSER
jgi:DNA helicase HerA-like ATPase